MEATPDWREELAERLGAPVEGLKALAGGASKETWAVDAGGERLVVRREAGGAIHEGTLSLRHEFEVIAAAFEAGVKVPRPVRYLGTIGGREAFAAERVDGETIGRRIVREPRPGLDVQLADELAKIHALPAERLPFLERYDLLDRLEHELDLIGEPHPAVEYGLWWLRERRPEPLPPCVAHGDFRIGNVVVGPAGVRALLDWEFAHVSDPREDLAWPLVRAWRFGADEQRLGGLAGVERYLERYNELTGRDVAAADLRWWEVYGNVRWAVGALNQGRRHLTGQAHDVELAVIGRLAAEVEYELLHLVE
jgi:aminoglycoside phosphotransferase (APT) family kinase protein